MTFLFILDPITTLLLKKDTSFILMFAAQERKHNVYISYIEDITSINFELQFHAKKVICEKFNIRIQSNLTLCAKEIDCIFIRKDPPVHHSYITMTWLMEFLPPEILCINSPHALRNFNEKIVCGNFNKLIPKTLITANKQEYLYFLEKYKKVILKPVDGFGGLGIFLVSLNDPNKHVSFEQLSKDMTQPVIIQKFIPESDQGDKRILLLNGEVLCSVLRVHSTSEHRNNFASGGYPQATTLSKRDLDIVQSLSQWLKKEKLYFVGIDILGEYLVEINITSPTCLQESMHIDQIDYSNEIIIFCENEIKNRKNNVNHVNISN